MGRSRRGKALRVGHDAPSSPSAYIGWFRPDAGFPWVSSGLHSHPFDAGWASSYMAWQSFGEGDDCDTLVHGVTSGGEFRDADEREREAFDAGWTAAHAEDED